MKSAGNINVIVVLWLVIISGCDVINILPKKENYKMDVYQNFISDNMNYDELAKRARYFKQDEKGVATMCKIMEDMRNEAAREAAQKAEQDKAKKTAVRLIKLGKMTLEEIAEATELTLDMVKELENQSMQLA